MDKQTVYEKGVDQFTNPILSELKEKALAEKCDGEYLEKIINHHKFNHQMYNGVPFLESITKTYKLLAPKSRQTDKYLQLIPYLAAVLDMLISVLVVVDDILDRSEMRSGKPCWYRIVGVGAAANDSHILIASAFFILRKHFFHLDCYTYLTELVAESLFVVGLGQHFDNEMSQVNYEDFTEENYSKMVRNKSSYSFYFSLGGVMYLAGYTEQESHEKAKEFSFQLGYLAQVQNDFWDCYKHLDSIVKSGTDIEEGKCTWLAVQFLKMASPEQKEVFIGNYGKRDQECVSRIKKLYNDQKLPEIYAKFLHEECAKLRNRALEDAGDIPSELYVKIIDGLFEKDLQNFTDGNNMTDF
ncbi:farnesyl pyrophosphate synthase-like [Lutzomyia longipalpis]|uniref:farnesyl pyrophosphate synthase-like n=1 Tax=Lutzomyia longipalpis TaxID=7200 RepID=UPI0024840B46|nr:farnesyl pyrophosphate synthase-like [Lutzomyia longipalpis]